LILGAETLPFNQSYHNFGFQTTSKVPVLSQDEIAFSLLPNRDIAALSRSMQHPMELTISTFGANSLYQTTKYCGRTARLSAPEGQEAVGMPKVLCAHNRDLALIDFEETSNGCLEVRGGIPFLCASEIFQLSDF
jgi:hypothetical protein